MIISKLLIIKKVIVIALLVNLTITEAYADNNNISKPIYLDYQATTPLDPRVLTKMLPYYKNRFGNPHATNHKYGKLAYTAVEEARKNIALFIGASDPKQIIFTSGATEANNIAIIGVLSKLTKKKIITCITEHKATLESAKSLEKEGVEVVFVGVKQDGLIDMEELEKVIDHNTGLVSVMAVNNEIGIIQPISEISKLAHKYGALFHTDATQAIGKIPINVEAMKIDLLSLSSHKMYGPQGIGALYIKKGINVSPLLYGGGQEKGIRPGTTPVALSVGFGKAAEIAKKCMAEENNRLQKLKNRFLKHLQRANIDIIVHGSLKRRIPGNLNIGFKNVEACDLIPLLPDLALSLGSACSSSNMQQSHVVTALKSGSNYGKTSLRIGMGRFTTEDEIDYAASKIIKAFRLLSNRKDTKIKIEKFSKKDIEYFAKRYDLVFVYKGTCPYCHLFASVLKSFSDKYKWKIIPISADEGTVKEFPETIHDFSVVNRHNIEYYPTLLAVHKKEKKSILIINKAIMEEPLLINNIISKLKAKT